jgi:arylesterase / paraoxonase
VLTDVIAVDMLVDNLSVDADGVVWGVGKDSSSFTSISHNYHAHIGFPRIMELMEHFINSDIKSAVTALRVSINTGRSAFFGEKYTVSKVGLLIYALPAHAHNQ